MAEGVMMGWKDETQKTGKHNFRQALQLQHSQPLDLGHPGTQGPQHASLFLEILQPQDCLDPLGSHGDI